MGLPRLFFKCMISEGKGQTHNHYKPKLPVMHQTYDKKLGLVLADMSNKQTKQSCISIILGYECFH